VIASTMPAAAEAPAAGSAKGTGKRDREQDATENAIAQLEEYMNKDVTRTPGFK
jgi:hypothetical protein